VQRGTADAVMLVVGLGLGVPFAVFWAVALADLVKRRDWEFPSRQAGSNPRLFWTFTVLLLSGIGAFFYYVMVMKPYPRQRR